MNSDSVSVDVDLAPTSTDEGARQQARMIGLGRAAIGIAMLLAPATSMRVWIKEGRTSSGARLVTRALGAREVALGAGLVLAIDKGGPVRGWMEAGVLVDTSDALVTLLSYKTLPRVGRTLVLLAAAGTAANGAVLARKLG
jgi:hypothetical protein